jgi:predicted TIM-barrel fold metal-dependent hydrolase
MIIDAHNHVLAAGLYPGYETFIKEMTQGYFQSKGSLPYEEEPTSSDWDDLHYLWEPIDPVQLLEDHDVVGVDRCVLLTVAPSDYTRYHQRGLVDIAGVTDVPGPPSIDKANDYMASLVRQWPDRFIGMAAVNPRYRGVAAAVSELVRSIEDLGLSGLKLYPMYDHWAVNDRALAYPIFEAARDLGIPVMIHMSTTPVTDTVLMFGWPMLLDEVAHDFPEVPILVCHTGHPWIDECLAIVARHRNVYVDISFFNSVIDRRETFEFLHRARKMGCPWTRICWATDYPGFEMPRTLLPKFTLVNDDAHGDPLIPAADIARMIGGNYSRFIGIEWSLDETLQQMEQLDETWRQIWATHTAEPDI